MASGWIYKLKAHFESMTQESDAEFCVLPTLLITSHIYLENLQFLNFYSSLFYIATMHLFRAFYLMFS